jgi:hypothetical protein
MPVPQWDDTISGISGSPSADTSTIYSRKSGCPEVTVDITLDDRRVDILEEAYDLAIRIGELED